MVGAEENKKSSKDSFLYNKQEKFMLLLHVAKTETIFFDIFKKECLYEHSTNACSHLRHHKFLLPLRGA